MPMEPRDLRESNEFLNILLENIPSLVLLADGEMQVREVNDASRVLFGLSREEMLGKRCGNALHCVFAETEDRLCGETSNCSQCPLRQSALATMLKKVPTDREKLIHTFFVDGLPEERHFEFSTRYVRYQGQEMVLLILYDVTTLERQKQELIVQQDKINESLKAAGCIQHALLPRRLPELENVRFAWRFKPCDAVGGDILNIVPLDESHIGLYLLDVAGHDFSSSMISVLAYQLMNPLTGVLLDHGISPPRIREPEEVLNILNREFPFMRFERHFTVVYAVLNTASGEMRYSNAAQCHPIVIPHAGELRPLTVSGTIIGLQGIPFGQENVLLGPGDKVVLLSDGVEEAPDPSGGLFGEERLHDTLRSLRHAPPEELAQGLSSVVTDFVGDRKIPDDISILVLEYGGSGADGNEEDGPGMRT
ncbi:sigma-B regulation protein RsbU (phosphoserine phosphatase) [Desulfonatronum zhilinae]|nr:sigma-B regulation protein RsbU (phosphoserine phosphatase) [Desulfonatronum zhilinae]